MSSATRQIPPSEWDRHKDTIVELYRQKTLKGVRAEMQNLHGFNASSSQYEMQLKRWNIRKNATRKEWQQYFSNTEHRSIPTSIDASGTTVPPIILSKSSASKKRASRWVPGSLVEQKASQASASTLSRNAARPIAASISDETLALEGGIQPEVQNSFTNVPNAFGGIETFPVQTDPVFSSMIATSDFVGSTSPAFFDVLGEYAQSLDLNLMPLHAFSPSAASDLQPPFFGQNSLDGAAFQDVGQPSENNMMFFNMLNNVDFKQKLPSAQLEHILRSKGIVLEGAAARTIFGGFAPRLAAGILSSNDQSMDRRTPSLQHFLRKLGSQVPGESSALLTGDQAFETKFARLLLFSVLNGFAGLDDVPMENILRFLNRFFVNKLLLDILEQCPRHVLRTLADNIFRAAIEATDTIVVKLLLDCKLVDANEIVCFQRGLKCTPIQRASELRSPRLMQALVDAGADVNKFYVNEVPVSFHDRHGGALQSLIREIHVYLNDSRSPMPPESIEALNILIAAGARVYPGCMILDKLGRTLEFDLLISQNVPSESHRDFFSEQRNSEDALLQRVAAQFDDRNATMLIRTVISLCHEASCNKCVVEFHDHLRNTVLSAAETGKIDLVQLLFKEADLESELPRVFIVAIRSQNHTLIDFILSKAPDLDPPPTTLDIGYLYGKFTPIAEAVRSGNEDLIRRLEAGGSLDRLSEGGRFGILVNAAAEAGNTAYMSKLLTRAVSSKQAYRITGDTLICALERDHDDIAQMLLEANSSANPLDLREQNTRSVLDMALGQSNAQMVRDLIAAGDDISHIPESYASTKEHCAIVLDLVHEYPGLRVQSLFTFVRLRIEPDTLDLLKEILETRVIDSSDLHVCLEMAVKFGHADLVEYFLDMGANPFNGTVLCAAIPDRPDMLRLLFQKDRLRQSMPKCIGARILVPVMGDGVWNAEALEALTRTETINFARLEILSDYHYLADFPREYEWIRFTPLGLAIQGVHGKFRTNMVAMKKFLDAGADPDGISKSNEHWTKGSPLMTALMVAIETGREDAVNMLLDYGADVNARPRIRTTRTALQYAAELGNMDMVRLLLSRGADVNSSASSRGGATALQFAALSGNCNMVACLLDHGAQLDALPSRIDGMWPLEGAAANGRLDMIRYLWELNVRAVAGFTFPDGFSEWHCLRAMNFARENGHIGCRDLISELSGVSVDRLETDEYGAPWIAY